MMIVLIIGWKLAPSIKIHQESVELPKEEEKVFINEPIQPIPLTVKEDPKKVELGSKLFSDTRLSHDNTVSCATCHNLKGAGIDHKRLSMGIDGQFGDVNAPTVYNSGFNFKQFWDGRADTLEDQVNGPTHNLKEMGSNWDEIIGKLKVDPNYVSAFLASYSDGITSANIRDAIATFERTLSTPNSRFDKFLLGDKNALTSIEKKGYELFKEHGCVVCHQGINVGSNMFQSFGKFGNYFEDRGNITNADLGRMNVTKNLKDRYKFKVPTLRNIELTAPYFHDGSVKTLDSAVQVMAKYQLGISFEPDEIQAIVQFLKTLTGEYEGKPLEGTRDEI